MQILRFVLILSLSANFCARCMHLHHEDHDAVAAVSHDEGEVADCGECSHATCGCNYTPSELVRFDFNMEMCDAFVIAPLTIALEIPYENCLDRYGPEPPTELSAHRATNTTVICC